MQDLNHFLLQVDDFVDLIRRVSDEATKTRREKEQTSEPWRIPRPS